MLIYLLKLIACSGLFYAFYFFFLQKEKMLMFNRFYLLGALVLSFIIPLITFKVEMPALDYETVAFNYTVATPQKPELSLLDTLQQLSVIIWIAIGCFLLVRLLRNLWMIYQKSRGADLYQNPGAKLILIDAPIIPHSFFDRIFLSKTAFENNQIDEAIIQHEMAHVKQLHSLDILIIEIMQCLLWFNPFVYLYKQSIKLNHEFLADNAATIGRADNLGYQQLLLKSIYVNNNIPLASSFYFFTTKKRLLMLQKKNSRQRSRVLIIAASVLATTGIVAFSSREIVYLEKQQSKNGFQRAIVEEVANGSVVDTVPERPQTQTKATPAEIEEYKRLEKEVLVKEANGKTRYKNDEKKAHRLQELYVKVYLTQQSKDFVEPPATTLPDNIESLSVITPKGKPIAILKYKNGKTVRADINGKEKQKAFEEKYGVEILPPPPPPPAPPATPKSVTVTEIPPPAAYSAPDDVESIAVTSNSQKKDKVVEVSYKDGRKIKEDISTKEKEQAFEKKYNIKLPEPPPPPSKPTQS